MTRSNVLALSAATTILVACAGDSPTDPAALAFQPVTPASYDAGPASNTRFGVVEAGMWDRDSATQQAAVNFAREAGVRFVRDAWYWTLLQPDNPDSFDPAVLEKVRREIRIIRRAGLEPYITLEGTPPWVRYCTPGQEVCDSRTPPHPDAWMWWRKFVGDIVAEFNSSDQLQRVDHWGIWNEPDAPAFLVPAPHYVSWQDVYWLLYNYAADAIHPVPGKVIHGPELSTGAGDSAAIHANFVSIISRLTFRIRPQDAITVHGYTSSTNLRNRLAGFSNYLNQALPNSEIWVTEVGDGDPQGELDQVNQARGVMYYYQMANDLVVPRVTKMFKMPFTQPTPAHDGYAAVPGLVHEGTPRLAYDCLRSLARGLTFPANCTWIFYVNTTKTTFPTYCRYQASTNVPNPRYKWRRDGIVISSGSYATIPRWESGTLTVSVLGDADGSAVNTQFTSC